MAFSIQCPNCEARLKIQNPKAVGKKVRCPNCENPFTVRPPKKAAPPPEDEFGLEDDYGDDYDDFEDNYEDDFGPPRRRAGRAAPARPRSSRGGGRSASKGKKKPKKSSKNNQTALIAGGAVLGFLLLLGLAFFIYQLAGGGGAKVDYAWLPPDSEVVISVDVDKVWNSNLAERIRSIDEEGVRRGLDEMKRELADAGFAEGESLDAIDSVTLGFNDAQKSKGLMVVRKKSPWNIDALKDGQRLEESTHDGKTYYTKSREATYFPDDTTMIVGDKEVVEAAMVRGPKSDLGNRFSFMPKGDIVMAALPKDMEKLARRAPGRGFGADADKVKGGAITINVGSGLDFEMLALCNSSEIAADFDKKIKEGVKEGKDALQKQREQMAQMLNQAPQFGSLFNEAEKILNSVSSSQSGDQVTVSMAISSSLIDTIEQMAKDQKGGGGFPFNPLDFMGAGNRKPFDMARNEPPPPGFDFPQPPPRNRPKPPPNPGLNFFDGIAQGREAAQRSQDKNNLKQIGLAMHNYHEQYRSLPLANGQQGSGLSWRVHILPHLDQANLYSQFHLNEPWDSPHNKQLIQHMPRTYARPGSNLPPGKTTYLGIDGQGGILAKSGGGTRFRDVTDGTSNTILVAEVKDEHAVTWTQPVDYEYEQSNPGKDLGGWRGGFHALFCDGAVMFISENISPAELLKRFQMNDGQPLDF